MRLRLSPFMNKRKPQPFLMEVLFRRSHEGRAGFQADAMRATGRDAGAEKTGIENEAADTKKTTSLFFDRRDLTHLERSETN